MARGSGIDLRRRDMEDVNIAAVGVRNLGREMAHPTGFEPVTSAFGGLRIEAYGLSSALLEIPEY